MKIEKSDLQLESLVRRINEGEIDLQPDFQRGEIWDKKRRQRLVDTVLRGWYVPAVHIVTGGEAGEVVLDGQQRLAAIRDFFDGKIKIDGTIDPPDERIASLHDMSFADLPEEVKRAVRRFGLQIITLSEYSPQEPNELFFRLNQSYNLTPPEKRNALHGQARDQVKRLVGMLIEDGLLDSRAIGFSNGRLAYDDIVARVCVALEVGTLRKHINNDVVEDYYRTKELSDRLIDEVREAGNLLLEQIRYGPEGGRVKFNKGTLQTWLVYCTWAPRETGSLPDGLLQNFERDRMHIRQGGSVAELQVPPFVGEVVRIYDDRASYRVTDVSSVLSRDLAIHVYSQSMFSTESLRGTDQLLQELSTRQPDEVQRAVSDFIEASSWGDPIPGV